MTVDMHCHLDLYPDPFMVSRQCKTNEKLYILSVTTTPKAWHGTLKLADNNPRIQTALGFHPQIVHERYRELELFDSILPDTKYIGEIGLDGSKNLKKHWDIQLKVFRHILHSIQNIGGRLMSIHSRASADAVLLELNKYSDTGIPILHWFTGNITELKKAVKQGCWFSVGPAMLNTKRGQELVVLIPEDKILSETDAPFVKVKNKPLLPWDASSISLQLAKIWKMDSSEVEIKLFENFKNLAKISGTW